MKIEVLLFGQISEIAGQKLIMMENVKDKNELLRAVYAAYPALSDMRFKIAINQQITETNLKLNDGDEVALLPPFAGG